MRPSMSPRKVDQAVQGQMFDRAETTQLFTGASRLRAALDLTAGQPFCARATGAEAGAGVVLAGVR